MECLLEINFRSLQDDINFEDILDRFRDQLRALFRIFSGFKIAFEHDCKSSLTSVLFWPSFWLGFRPQFGFNLVTFSIRGGVPCGCRPSSDLIRFIFSIFSLSEPSWIHVGLHSGLFSGPFWENFRVQTCFFEARVGSCVEKQLLHTQQRSPVMFMKAVMHLFVSF